MERSISTLMLLSLMILSCYAQDKTNTGATDSTNAQKSYPFLEDHLKPASSLSPSEKEQVKKVKNMTYYNEEGERISKEQMMRNFREKGEPQAKVYVDSSLKASVAVITGYKKPEPSKTGKGEGNPDDRSIPEKFQLELLNGKTYTFSKSGKRDSILVLNFWFTACKPCKMEIPELNGLVQHFEGKPVRFQAITYEKTSKIRGFLKERSFTYHHGIDGRKVIRSFAIQSFPAHIVVDRKGKVRFFKTGYNHQRVGELKKAIEKSLN